jgi:hypothetical protein
MDITAIEATVSTVSQASQIVGALIKQRDKAMIAEAVAQLNELLMSAQGQALAAQKEQFALAKSKDQLEKRVLQLENWEAEKQRYKLVHAHHGTFAYLLDKESVKPGETVHLMCQPCADKGQKGVLQDACETIKGNAQYHCPLCTTKYAVDWERLVNLGVITGE